MTEFIGYLASALVAASLLTSNVLRLRVLNLCGAAVFIVYGGLTRAWPVLAVNLFIAGIDLWYIISLKARKDIFKLMPVETRDPLLADFLAYYARGIWQFFPDFSLSELKGPHCIFILRNLMPVGLFIYTEESPDIAVHLDFVADDYRDLKSARYLFNRPKNQETFVGFTSFTAQSSSPKHTDYLRRLGFEEDGKKKGTFRKKI
ncbi:MAG: hypothetical protein COX65_01435 [Elusimicrobia bacterium CG_4_10_14_0_2_um_filter_56_8]|nr:MAG: hypothetical protein AUJ51_11260 [Elusimicrobia bacterium CG1_02_56_21]PJA16981.1 MAG: hypothetical protein COX65_01435 [Elusimicrobia bacterium CG_4_10_14_0_2_um_filter_56_8]